MDDIQYHFSEIFYMSSVIKLNVSIKLKYKAVLILILIQLLAAQVFAQSVEDKKTENNKFQQTQYSTIEWVDLIPQAEFDILLNPPSYINEIVDGSEEDQVSSSMKNTRVLAKDDPYQQALVSTNIKPEMDGRLIRIPGFVVPLEFDGEQVITEFFLVPFFGACIHVPPPPPNQIIYVEYPKGLKLEVLYDPFWISGTLKTSLVENDMATAAYTMVMKSYEAYTEENASYE